MKKKITVSLIAILIVIILGILILFNYRKRNEQEVISSDNYTSTYYQVLDCYSLPDHESFSEIIEKQDIVNQFGKLLEEFVNAKTFRYLEVYKSLLQYEGVYKNGKEFVYEYGSVSDEKLDEFINQEISLKEKNVLLTNLKGIFISERAFNEDFALQKHIEKGNNLTSTDFIYNKERINIILGYNYVDLYNLGDEISIFYLGFPLKLKVNGFLKESSIIELGTNKVSLDSYIIMPSFEVKTDSISDTVFCAMHYSNKTKGFFKVNNSNDIITTLDEFKAIVKRVGLDYVYIPVPD